MNKRAVLHLVSFMTLVVGLSIVGCALVSLLCGDARAVHLINHGLHVDHARGCDPFAGMNALHFGKYGRIDPGESLPDQEHHQVKF